MMKGKAHCQPQESQTHGTDLLGEQWCLWCLRAQVLGVNMRNILGAVLSGACLDHQGWWRLVPQL